MTEARRLWFVWGPDHDWKEPILSRHAHVHGDPEPSHRCDVCGEGFFSVEDWSDHHFEAHFSRDDGS